MSEVKVYRDATLDTGTDEVFIELETHGIGMTLQQAKEVKKQLNKLNLKKIGEQS